MGRELHGGSVVINISVEIWPHGDESKKEEIAKGMIANDGTGTPEVGNYVYSIHSTKRHIKGRVQGHNRELDVLELLRLVLNQHKGGE